MNTIRDKIRNAAIGFIALFTLNILNLFIPFFIYSSVTGITDYAIYLSVPSYLVSWDALVAEDTYQMILVIIQIAITIWILLNLQGIEHDLTSDEKHFKRTVKYYFLLDVMFFLTLYGGALMMLLMFLSFVFLIILLYCMIGGIIGMVYFAIYIYTLGKETDNKVLQIGGILFLLDPLISGIGLLTTYLGPFMGILSVDANTLVVSTISLTILTSVHLLIIGFGFFLLQNSYEGARYGRRSSAPRAGRTESREVPRYQRSSPDYSPPTTPTRVEPSWISEPRPSSLNTSSQDEQQARCPNCGYQYPADDQFCKNCGRFLAEDQ